MNKKEYLNVCISIYACRNTSMCAYFCVQIYQAEKFTQTIEKLLKNDSGAFQSHYIAQKQLFLKEIFIDKNKED